MARLVGLLSIAMVIAAGSPAAALTCLDPHTQVTRESGTDSCLLGEVQVLPNANAPAESDLAVLPDPAPPVSPAPSASLICLDPHTGISRESDTGDCRLGEQQVLPEGPTPAPQPAARQIRSGCLAATPDVVEAEQLVRTSLAGGQPVRQSVVFGSGRMTIALDGGSFTADLGRLNPAVVIDQANNPAAASWSQVTLRCRSSKCWEWRGGRGNGPAAAPSASFLVPTRAKAEQAAQALGKLIGLCGSRREERAEPPEPVAAPRIPVATEPVERQ